MLFFLLGLFSQESALNREMFYVVCSGFVHGGRSFNVIFLGASNIYNVHVLFIPAV